MPKIRCKCDNIISYSEIPNPNEYLIISDVAYDKFDEKIGWEELRDEMKSILYCNSCGGLWIYWNGWNEDPTFYLPQENK